MPFVIEKSGSALICQPEGLVNSANAAVFEADLMAQVEKGERHIVLDLARLNYISSAGLRVVLLLAKKLKQADGALIQLRYYDLTTPLPAVIDRLNRQQPNIVIAPPSAFAGKM